MGFDDSEEPNIFNSIPKEYICQVFSLDKDQLYSLLDKQVSEKETALPESFYPDILEFIQKRAPDSLEFTRSEKKGRGWLKDHISSIKPLVKKTLCDDLHYCKDEQSILADLTVVITALVPVIVSGLGIPAATVVTIVVLLAKYYGRVLCGCEELSSGKK